MINLRNSAISCYYCFSIQITLKMELMEGYRIGLLTVVRVSLGKMYPLVAPLNNITPDFDHPVLDVHSSVVN